MHGDMVAELLISRLGGLGSRAQTGSGARLPTPKAHLHQPTFSREPPPLESSTTFQIVPPDGNQMFKHVSLRHFYLSHSWYFECYPH